MDEKRLKALALERVKGLKIAAECNKYHWCY